MCFNNKLIGWSTVIGGGVGATSFGILTTAVTPMLCGIPAIMKLTTVGAIWRASGKEMKQVVKDGLECFGTVLLTGLVTGAALGGMAGAGVATVCQIGKAYFLGLRRAQASGLHGIRDRVAR